MRNLLQKYIKGDCTSEEKIQILHWIEESPEHLKEYKAARKLYDIFIWNSFPKQKKRLSFKFILRESAKIAAVLMIGAILSIAITKYNTPEAQMQTIYVPAGERAELNLSDGTKVWINSGSTLTFPDRFTNRNRQVLLEGEAYFDVQKSGSSNFIVQTAQFDINVLGTEFNVKAYKEDDAFQVALFEGSLEVSSDKQAKPIRLKPNQLACSEEGKKLIVEEIDNLDHFRWREGFIYFEQETIEELFKKLEIYFDVKITSNNKDLLKYPYSGKLWIRDGIEHILRVLQLEHKLEYKINAKKTEITIL